MKKLLVIIGPTGTGKTDLALELAKKFGGEIVSADSRQIYIGMDIGTGKLSQNEKIEKHKGYWIVDEIPIHLYDVITPSKTFSVAEYQQIAYRAINEIHKKNKLPILVGGTGLYIRAVVEGLKIPKVAPDANLRKRLEAYPLPKLITELERSDPQTAARVDKANPRRVIRALEVFYKTGQSMSQLQGKYKTVFNHLKIGLSSDRAHLYSRVDDRVDSWVKNGFIEEVKTLLDKGYQDSTALTSLGYRQITMYLQGKITLPEAIQRIKFEHHAYIRAQLTWFKKESVVTWFDINEKDFTQKIFKTINSWVS
ncbi:MAG: tRNA (adenosine(37)-N6)-dimethylallyltransferase MiaA [bacterium]|nr:tRNA (adenosine(37)-N6)-dimethylallyltransferase MiaA [bacterium]